MVIFTGLVFLVKGGYAQAAISLATLPLMLLQFDQ